MYEKWSEEEVIWAYLLSKAPKNREYQKKKNGMTIPHWSKPNYERVSLELSIARNLYNIGTDERKPSEIESILESRRVHIKDLSSKIKRFRVNHDYSHLYN